MEDNSKLLGDHHHHTTLTAAAADSNYLNKQEMQQIFSKLPAIYKAHVVIYEKLKAVIYHWSDNHKIGQIWTEAVICIN